MLWKMGIVTHSPKTLSSKSIPKAFEGQSLKIVSPSTYKIFFPQLNLGSKVFTLRDALCDIRPTTNSAPRFTLYVFTVWTHVHLTLSKKFFSLPDHQYDQ